MERKKNNWHRREKSLEELDLELAAKIKKETEKTKARIQNKLLEYELLKNGILISNE